MRVAAILSALVAAATAVQAQGAIDAAYIGVSLREVVAFLGC